MAVNEVEQVNEIIALLSKPSPETDKLLLKNRYLDSDKSSLELALMISMAIFEKSRFSKYCSRFLTNKKLVSYIADFMKENQGE